MLKNSRINRSSTNAVLSLYLVNRLFSVNNLMLLVFSTLVNICVSIPSRQLIIPCVHRHQCISKSGVDKIIRRRDSNSTVT